MMFLGGASRYARKLRGLAEQVDLAKLDAYLMRNKWEVLSERDGRAFDWVPPGGLGRWDGRFIVLVPRVRLRDTGRRVMGVLEAIQEVELRPIETIVADIKRQAVE